MQLYSLLFAQTFVWASYPLYLLHIRVIEMYAPVLSNNQCKSNKGVTSFTRLWQCLILIEGTFCKYSRLFTFTFNLCQPALYAKTEQLFFEKSKDGPVECVALSKQLNKEKGYS